MKLDITGIGSELQGVGRAPDGRVVFVPGALPGETVDIDSGTRCIKEGISLCDDSSDDTGEDISASAAAHSGVAGVVRGCEAAVRYDRTCTFEDDGYAALFGIFLGGEQAVLGYHGAFAVEKSCHFAHVGSYYHVCLFL